MKNNNIFMGIFVLLGCILMGIVYLLRATFFLLPILIPVILVVMLVIAIKGNKKS